MKILFCFLLSFIAFIAHAQRGVHADLIGSSKEVAMNEFRVEFKKRTIGTYKVTKYQKADSVVYAASSEIKFHFFGPLHVKYELQGIFVRDTLVMSKVKTYRNGTLSSETTTSLEDAHYKLMKNGKLSILDRDNIKRSVVQLYHEPPVNGERVYSEGDGSFKQVSEIYSSEFKVGNVNPSIFKYRGNQLNRVDITFKPVKYSIVR